MNLLRTIHPYDGMHDQFSDFLLPVHPPGFQAVPVNSRFFLREQFLRENWAVKEDAANHPRGVAYRVPAGYRAAAHALSNPDCVLTGFGALALYGLPVLVEGHDTVLIDTTISRNHPADTWSPARVRDTLRLGETWQVVARGQPVRVTAPAVAVVHALRAIKKKEVTWPVETIEDDPVFVRAVQFVDAARRFLALPPEDIAAAAGARINNRWISRIIAASSALAESPKETEMRLILRRVADTHGYTLAEQVPCRHQGRLITTLDAALLEVRYGYMYDGGHHYTKQQRGADARINIELQLIDVRPMRYCSGTLATIPATTEQMLVRDGHLPNFKS